MFNKVGTKIKIAAIICLALIVVGSIVGGIVIICIDVDLTWVGILVMAGGPLVSLIPSWIIYGFGEIVENTFAIKENTATIKEKAQNSSVATANDSYELPNL